MLKVFFNASVIFAALYSQKGGSHKLAQLVKYKKIIGATSQTVIEELEENIKKIKEVDSKKLSKFILDFHFIVREEITQSEIKPFLGQINTKDAHVVAGAILTGCDYLLTLDKKHLNNPVVKAKIIQTKIVSPKDLLKQLAERNP